MENRIMFGLEKENESWRVFSMISINGGTWSYPRMISKPFSTREQAEAEARNQMLKPDLKNWHVGFEPY